MFSLPWGKRRRSHEKPAQPIHRTFPQGTELKKTTESSWKKETMDMDHNTGSNDYLLRQIDEFREKASELQSLLRTRENKAQELQVLVEEKRREADDLSAGVNRSVERIMDRVCDRMDRKFDEMNSGLDEKLNEASKSADNTEEIKKMISEIKMPEVDTEKITEELKGPIEDFKNSIDDVKKPVQEATKEVGGMKGEILEKIHTEGVQVFRNTRDLIDEQSQKLESVAEMKTELKSVKTTLKISLWFGIINFVVLIVYVLFDLGVFNFK